MENVRFTKHRFTVQTIVTALPSPHRTYFPLTAVRHALRVTVQTAWQHRLTKRLAQFSHSRAPLQPDLLENQTRSCMQMTLQKAFSQRLKTLQITGPRSPLHRIAVECQCRGRPKFSIRFSQIPSRLRVILSTPPNQKETNSCPRTWRPPLMSEMCFFAARTPNSTAP